MPTPVRMARAEPRRSPSRPRVRCELARIAGAASAGGAARFALCPALRGTAVFQPALFAADRGGRVPGAAAPAAYALAAAIGGGRTRPGLAAAAAVSASLARRTRRRSAAAITEQNPVPALGPSKSARSAIRTSRPRRPMPRVTRRGRCLAAHGRWWPAFTSRAPRFYRARLTGLSRGAAAEACERLSQRTRAAWWFRRRPSANSISDGPGRAVLAAWPGLHQTRGQ